MPTAMPAFIPQRVKTSIIKVYSYEGRNPSGVLLNPYFKNGAVFENLTQLLFLIEELQDALNFPQKGMDSRRFDVKGKRVSPLSEAFGGAPPTGKCLATFRVNILFRRNASWQGSVIWTERKMDSPFRSVWELIMLMDGALTDRSDSSANDTAVNHPNIYVSAQK